MEDKNRTDSQNDQNQNDGGRQEKGYGSDRINESKIPDFEYTPPPPPSNEASQD